MTIDERIQQAATEYANYPSGWVPFLAGAALGREVGREEQANLLAEAVQLLKEYGGHNAGCSAVHGNQYRCRCRWNEEWPKFQEAIRAATKPDAGGGKG